MKKKVSRREFLKDTAYGVLGAGVALGSLDAVRLTGKLMADQAEKPEKATEKKRLVEYRTLGKTGLKVTTVGFGAMTTREPAVIQRGLDLGVNYVDTARAYMHGLNEEIVGRTIKGRRKEVILATKFKRASKEVMRYQMEQSLKALKTDYVDIIQVHNLKKAEQPKNEEAMEIISQFKKEGKVRFCGVTTHKRQPEVVDAVIETGFYDMVLVQYNFRSPEEIKQAVARAHKAGLGVVAMKTQAGGYRTDKLGGLTPHQAALKWVLSDKNVTCAIPGMVTIKEVEEDTAVMGKKLTWSDRKALELYGRRIARFHCRTCGGCEGACPRGVDVQEINRYLMYAEGYGELNLARMYYRSLPAKNSAGNCPDCRRCLVRCRYGLNIASRMRKAASVLS